VGELGVVSCPCREPCGVDVRELLVDRVLHGVLLTEGLRRVFQVVAERSALRTASVDRRSNRYSSRRRRRRASIGTTVCRQLSVDQDARAAWRRGVWRRLRAGPRPEVGTDAYTW
jgi:hypothetical protein